MGMSSRKHLFRAVDNNNNTTNGCLGIRFNADIGTSGWSMDMDFKFLELDANEFKFKPKDLEDIFSILLGQPLKEILYTMGC